MTRNMLQRNTVNRGLHDLQTLGERWATKVAHEINNTAGNIFF